MRNRGYSQLAIDEFCEKHEDRLQQVFYNEIADGANEYDAWKVAFTTCEQEDVQEMVTRVELPRANKVTVQTTEGMARARFWKTHKLLREVTTEEAIELGYTVDNNMNATAQRELFRAWVCKNATKIGIDYDPSDKRSTGNMFPSKYTNDELLTGWSVEIVKSDINEWTDKIAEEYDGVELVVEDISADDIEEVTNRNGRDVSPKYNNGNWAYAKIPVTATISYQGTEGYVTMEVELVSGQLKKPTVIGAGKYNFTGFKQELMVDMKQYLPKTIKEMKEDKKKSEPVETNASEEISATKDEPKLIGYYKDGTPRYEGLNKDGSPKKRGK